MRSLSRFRIVEPMSGGGMGVVYRAEDLTLRRPVAIKFLADVSPDPARQRARLLREARTAAALNHPNICVIFDTGEIVPGEAEAAGLDPPLAAGTPYLVMELVEGRTLHELLEESGPLPWKMLIRCATQIAEGLAAAHGSGIVHRDLKPQNVMVGTEGRVKILDFGLAKALEAEPDSDPDLRLAETLSTEIHLGGKVMGTLAYLSPERALGKPADTRSDIFSFGAVLYQMASGKLPFRGASTTAIIAKILETDPEPIDLAGLAIPADLGRILDRCLRKNPDERYNDTRDLVTDLRDVAETSTTRGARGVGEPAPGHERTTPLPAPARHEAPRAPQRMRRLLMRAVIPVVLLAVVAFVVWRTEHARTPRTLPQYRQLTFSGLVRMAALSPEGEAFAYVTGTADGRQEVHLQHIAGGSPLTIFARTKIWAICWSPDGSKLLVNSGSGPGGQLESWLVPRLGGEPRAIASPALRPLAWSPDGSRLACFRSEGGLRLLDTRSGAITSVPMTDGMQRVRDIQWAPNGDRLLVSYSDASGREIVKLLHTDGDRSVPIFDNASEVTGVRWSPDGRALYFLRSDRQQNELWKLRLHAASDEPTGKPIRVLAGVDLAGYSIAQDERTLLTCRTTRRTQVVVLELPSPGGGVPRATTRLTEGTTDRRRPRFSPDGEQIAFIQAIPGGDEICVVPAGGGTTTQLTHLAAGCHDPDWSPDGSEIAFLSSSGSESGLWIVSVPQGRIRRLTAGDGALAGAGRILAWSPGERILTRTSEQRNYVAIDPRTGARSLLFARDLGGAVFQLRQSPDGRRIAFTRNVDPAAGITVWLVSWGEREPRLLYDGRAAPIGWSPDGRWVYLVRESRGLPGSPTVAIEVVRVQSDGTELESIMTLPSEPTAWSNVDLSPDADRLVYIPSDYESDAWLVRDFDPDVK